MPRERGWLLSTRDGGVEEACAVEVERELELAAGLGQLSHFCQRPDAPPGAVVRILDRDDPRRRHVAQIAPSGRLAYLFGREAAGPAWKWPGHQPRVDCGATELSDQQVCVLLGDQLVTRI